MKRVLLSLLNQVIAQATPGNIAIEVCSACNHRCVYCPVHADPFRQEVMSMEKFICILDKLMGLGRLRSIALNHYNEPFMDPHIVDRVHEVLNREMTRWLVLYTNASMIKPEHLLAFRGYRKQLGFNVNLPTVLSSERYEEVQGRNDLAGVEAGLEALIEGGFLVQINVQANEHTSGEDFRSVVERYGNRVKKVRRVRSSTRSNLVLNERYGHQGKLVGCTLYRHTNYLHIGVDGALFLCAEDYYKKSRFANLLTDSLDEVLNSPERKKYLDYLSGKKDAPANLICRSCKHAIVEDRMSGLNGSLNWFIEAVTSNNLLNRF